MQVAPAQEPGQAKTAARTARTGPWLAATAGVVAIAAVAVVTPPDSLKLGTILESSSIGMRKPDAVLAFSSPLKLHQHFQTIGYDLDAVRRSGSPVPRIFLARVPDGLAAVKQSSQRKDVFLKVMLPLILEANERVQRKRAHLLMFDAKLAAGQSLSARQQQRLEAIAAEYRADPDRIDILLRRVDAVPPSLALAQAAIESGWGTSRFVREGNAVFGQWTWGNDAGIVPLGREDGKTHKIKSFAQLKDSVRSYVHNLNTHKAYRGFRETRLIMRQEGDRLSGLGLVPTMGSYSEIRGKYMSLLRNIITTNELQLLDGARLRDGPGARRGTDA